ncbi:hypothetical protein [Shewanella sp.]|uniref:hypothetical protein n=1 Tax=Shewanella sp. TaxID=50422 RepID=UPI001EB52E17|nr:hypothetical protein [Shewanella sp.]NRB23483.1 hypothetical protein [Shewanella sp.]
MLKLNRNHTIKISVKDDRIKHDSTLTGELKLSEGKYPNFDAISIPYDHAGWNQLPSKVDSIKCLTENGQQLTLIECICEVGEVAPRYVKSGWDDEIIHTVSFSLAGLSKWFLQRKADLEKAKNTTDSKATLFSFDLVFKHNEYIVSCFVDKSISNDKETDVESVFIEFKANKSLSLNEVEWLVIDSKHLFSIILGRPLVTEQVKVNGREFYFSSPKIREIEVTTSRDELSNASLLLHNELWEKIFTSCFVDKRHEFKNIWLKIPLYMSYDHISDLEVMSFVSILEAKSTIFANESEKSLPKEERKKLLNDLKLVVAGFKEKNTSEENSKIYDTISDSFGFTVKSTSIHTFKDKIKHLIDSLHEDIKSIFNLSTQEINQLVEIRNASAHGRFAKYKDNINSYQLENKLKLFLLYLAHRDLGISDQHFCKQLNYSLNRIKLNAGLNRMLVDKLSGDVQFLDVSKADWDLINNSNLNTFALLHRGDSYEYLSEISEIISKDWPSQTKHRQLDAFVKELYAPYGDAEVRYVGGLYVQYESSTKRLFQACFVKPLAL